MSREKPRTPRGMRDFVPEEKRRRDFVAGRIRAIFERYGYEPIETPAVELFSVLRGKLGDEGEQLLFKIMRRGTALEDLRLGKVQSVTVEDFDEVVDSALRFDLTVPFSRFLAAHRDLPRPFKRYQIAPVWRAERQQRGRFREFYQCDIDVAGSDSMIADAEIISIVVETLLDLGFEDFTTHIGHRKLLSGLIESAGGLDYLKDISTSIDKFDKIGLAGVTEEMGRRGVPGDIAAKMLELISISGSTEEVLKSVEKVVAGTQTGEQGIAETRELFGNLNALGVPEKNRLLDLRLVRGLDYYTGPVFESIVQKPAIGSLTGGGRYDNLIKKFIGEELPAVGTSIGFERIIDVMNEFKMFPHLPGATEVLVTIFNDSTRNDSLALAGELRRAGIRCETPLKRVKGLKKQITYARDKKIPILAILGPDEISNGELILRSGPEDQRSIKRGDAPIVVRQFLDQLD